MRSVARILYISGLAFTVGFFGVGLVVSKQTAIGTIPEERQVENFLQEVVELTNAERKAHGVAPLKLQNTLRQAAMWLAEDMAEKAYLNHTDSLSRDLLSRLSAFGYTNVGPAAENIARGAAEPRKVVDGWMKSEEHRASILNPDLWEVGVGYAWMGRNAERYWVQDFGRRFDTYPLIINNEAARTTTTTVELYIYGCSCPREGARLTGKERVLARSGRAGDLTPGAGGYEREGARLAGKERVLARSGWAGESPGAGGYEREGARLAGKERVLAGYPSHGCMGWAGDMGKEPVLAGYPSHGCMGRAGDITPGTAREWEIRFSNNGINWTPWETYRSYRTWSLTPGTGTRQVHMELRNAGKTLKAKDIIMLVPADSDAPTHSGTPKIAFGKRG